MESLKLYFTWTAARSSSMQVSPVRARAGMCCKASGCNGSHLT